MHLIEQCKKNTLNYFGDLYAAFIDRIPELLNDKIATAQHDMQRNLYLEARKCIEPQQRQILQRYRRALTQAFDDFAAGYDPDPDFPYDCSQLALVDKSQYEDDVAIRGMANKCAAVNAEQLWKLNRRFAVVRGGRKCPEELNPCGPHQLCDAMRESYRGLDMDAAIRLWLYKLYDQQVMSKCGVHYVELNQQLAQEGVLKTLSFRDADATARRAVASGGAKAAAAPLPQPPAEANAANDAAHLATGAWTPAGSEAIADIPLVSPEVERRQARVIDAIRSVQQKRHQSGAPRTGTMGGASYGPIEADGVAGQANTFTPRELSIALGVLQAALQLPAARKAQPCRVSETENKLMGELGTLAEQQNRQKVTALDADTIDLVGMLFDYMLDDPQLPDGLKSLLSHLHTPYLKVALLDREFFASAKHPARCLLDAMAAAGARWVREGDDDEKVYQRIRLVVERIINEFDDDLAFFDELLKEFTRFVKVLERRADLATQRSVEAEKGLDQLSRAKDLADREILRRIEGARLPDPIRELLVQPWSDLLVFSYLRHGASSDSWRTGLEVVERVVRSVEPPRGDTVPEALQAEHAALNALVEEGFKNLGYDRDAGQRLLEALRDAQAQALRGQTPRLDAVKYVSKVEAHGSAIARQLEQQHRSRDGKPKTPRHAGLSTTEKALADTLSSVSFGTWFEFKRGIGAPGQRLKLSWYSSISGNYMFVNHSGVKTLVKALPELIKGMNDGSIVMVERESKNFFERAISSVLARLNKA